MQISFIKNHLTNKWQIDKFIILQKHWNNESVKRNAEGVKNILSAEGFSLNSSWDKIVTCLNRTVAPNFCIPMAFILKYVKKGDNKCLNH